MLSLRLCIVSLCFLYAASQITIPLTRRQPTFTFTPPHGQPITDVRDIVRQSPWNEDLNNTVNVTHTAVPVYGRDRDRLAATVCSAIVRHWKLGEG